MKENGSPKPVFETDNDYNYFLAVLPIHPAFKKSKQDKQVNLGERALKILKFCIEPKSRREILEYLNLANHTSNYKRHIEPLIKARLLKLT